MAKVHSGEEQLFLQEYPRGVYDPKREWLVDFEEIAGFDTAHLTTEVVMNRPLNGLVWPCRDAGNVMKEAYDDGDGINCVVRQICAKYKKDRAEVEAEFDKISETIQPERKKGITAIQILEWCKLHGVTGYIIWNGALIAKSEAAKHVEKSLVVHIIGGHAYFMESSINKFHHMEVITPSAPGPRKLALQPRPNEDATFKDWEQWHLEVQTNQQLDAVLCYYAGDMNEVRDAYLRCGYVPKQVMKDMLSIRMLKVHDFGGRAVTIHSVPAEHDELLNLTS